MKVQAPFCSIGFCAALLLGLSTTAEAGSAEQTLFDAFKARCVTPLAAGHAADTGDLQQSVVQNHTPSKTRGPTLLLTQAFVLEASSPKPGHDACLVRSRRLEHFDGALATLGGLFVDWTKQGIASGNMVRIDVPQTPRFSDVHVFDMNVSGKSDVCLRVMMAAHFEYETMLLAAGHTDAPDAACKGVS